MQQLLDRSEVLTTLEGILAAHIGATMARASTRGQCEVLGLEGDRMSDRDVEALIGKLGLGLAVFLGRPSALDVVAQMKRAVLEPGGSK